MSGLRPALLFAALLSPGLSTPAALFAADDPQTSGRRADQEALKDYGPLVGDWRGTGQPRRGSARDTWRESASWTWELTPESAALVVTIEDGKYLRSARLRPSSDHPGAFEMEALLADGSKRSFSGTADDRKRLLLEAEGSEGEGPRRISLTPLHETRFLMLLEGRSADSGLYDRIGEVGYTRQGVAFAAGDSYPLCIVTGGRGETEVTYKGMTYWVCCSGCKDLFEEDPEAILVEAAERDDPE